jgi:hypothetical protein
MCFYINLPIGAVTLITVFFLVKIPTAKSTLTLRQRILELDLPGAAVLLPAIICLVLALQWGGVKYAWSSGTVIGLFVASGVLFIFFAGVQWKRGDAATMPPRVIKIRSIWAASLFAALFGGAFFSIVYYVCTRVFCSSANTRFRFISKPSRAPRPSSLAFESCPSCWLSSCPQS